MVIIGTGASTDHSAEVATITQGARSTEGWASAALGSTASRTADHEQAAEHQHGRRRFGEGLHIASEDPTRQGRIVFDGQAVDRGDGLEPGERVVDPELIEQGVCRCLQDSGQDIAFESERPEVVVEIRRDRIALEGDLGSCATVGDLGGEVVL